MTVGIAHPPEQAAKLRGFIWDHWRAKRRGRIAAVDTTKEGHKVTADYAVMRDSAGEWCVHISIHRDQSYEAAVRTSQAISCRLERIQVMGIGDFRAVAKTAAVLPESYVLILKDSKSGKVVNQF